MKTELIHHVHQGHNRVLIVLLSVFLSVFFLSGCQTEADTPPVLVSDASCLLVSVAHTFVHAGISFSCQNISDREISSVEVSFAVYVDESGGNPLYGSNVIRADVDAHLCAGDSETFEISLDEKIAYIPEKPFFIDYFYVRHVSFSDGSEWSDPLGLYYKGSLKL